VQAGLRRNQEALELGGRIYGRGELRKKMKSRGREVRY